MRKCWPLLMTMFAAPAAVAQVAGPAGERFTVGDIRVEGLQRVTEGTVYNYLPVNIGDDLSSTRLREAMRSLYATGFFSNVEMRRDGSTLVVVVSERPSIESFEIKGNKEIKTEELTKSLRNLGLRQAEFRPVVDRGSAVWPHRPVLQPRPLRP